MWSISLKEIKRGGKTGSVQDVIFEEKRSIPLDENYLFF